MEDLDNTCWRGMEIAHPPRWELAVASAAQRPGECVFADRHYQRLAVKWKRVKYKPDVSLLVQKFRHKLDKAEDIDLVTLEDLPEPWQGVLQTTPDGQLTQAMRAFEESRTVVEATLIWPGRRKPALEHQVLEGMAPQWEDGPVTRWRALGFDVLLHKRFQLTKSTPHAGRIHWEFDADEKAYGPLVIERLSLAGGWMTAPLHTWMAESLPVGGKVLHQRQVFINGHRAQELCSQNPISKLAGWMGLWRMRVDLAWQCPVENRLYRISYSKRSRVHDIRLPETLTVKCCQVGQAVVSREQADAGRRKSGRPKEKLRSTEPFLRAVPYANQDMDLTRKTDGTGTAVVPMAKPRYLVPPISWILPFGRSRRVSLDQVGMSVLDLCDGRRPVEKVIEIFAANNKLTFREAQLPVTLFLRQLTQRGIIAIVGKENK